MTELKLNEVMIGDFVDVRSRAYPNNVHYEEITPAHLFRDEIWYGIPLKRIHLTKNGFKAIDPSDEIFVYKNGYEVQVIFDGGFPELKIPSSILLIINFAEKDLTMPIEYLHQLQDAMRLFGIYKKMKL